MTSDHRPLRTFGRIKARTLKPRQAGLMETLLPHLAVPAEGEIDVDALFSEPSPLWGGQGGGAGGAFSGVNTAVTPPPAPAHKGRGLVLEIGFGGGEHLIAQASAKPGQRFIGVEPFINGVASCLRHIEESGVQNVRIHNGDARDVIARLPGASLDLCYIPFPDPWPKERHHKHRLLQADFFEAVAGRAGEGARLYFRTDHLEYFRAVEAIMEEYDGRPHWGKRHYQTAATLRPRYPQWDRFTAVRDRLDPERKFENDYLRRVLGP